MKTRCFSRLAKMTAVGCILPSLMWQAVPSYGQQSPNASTASRTAPMHLPYAQFQIPFNIDTSGSTPSSVQLWVSTDDGATWQMHGSAQPTAKFFEFRAASEGLYLFSVQTLDASGASFPSTSPPLRVLVDTSKPQAAMRADIDSQGKLVVDVRVADQHLAPATAWLRMRTDRSADWQEIQVDQLTQVGSVWEGQVVLDVPHCREIGLIFTVKDEANNVGEATLQLGMPRTAAGEKDMQLASTHGPGESSSRLGSSNTATVNTATSAQHTRSGQGHPSSALQPLAGATLWDPTQPSQPAATTPPPARRSPGSLVGSSELTLDGHGQIEELPPPAESERSHPVSIDEPRDNPLAAEPPVNDVADEAGAEQPSGNAGLLEGSERLDTVANAYHCKSRAFSLDYSIEALGGSALADVELWGTEDGGRTWNLWGSDPDRQSPFDVQVGNDGLFGFRMVIVGGNGLVSNRPKHGDSSDVWINIDTETPSAKITRAVYGEGPEDGMLVIDYTCHDSQLVSRPITLSFSERLDGPWTTIATGLKNTGIYLWKADPNLPDRIYLKLDVVDKAGNIGTHRLDLPIDIKGLAPRGRIQGFRPINLPAK